MVEVTLNIKLLDLRGGFSVVSGQDDGQQTIDDARVAEIRESISAGRYQINPSKIADGLISTVRDLLNQNSR